MDSTLDRSYDYDHVGRLIEARTGSEARGHLIGQGGAQDGPYAHSYRYDQWGNMWYRVGWGGWFNPWLEQWPNYVNNRLTTVPGTSLSISYDAAGNLINDGSQTYIYDATGQQTSGGGVTQNYDGDRLRVKKIENNVTTYYLRSSVLGGQVISELNASGVLQRGYVYLGSQMLAIQQNNQVSWVHQDPVTKSQRITNASGTTITSTIDLDPWGGETARSSNQAFQPHRYTTYERDGNGSDEAMMRRHIGKWHRFSQADPADSSYDWTNPQSFNRYAYTQNDPVNLIDPFGLDPDGGVLGGQLAGLVNIGPGTSIVDAPFADFGGFFGGMGGGFGGEMGMVIDPEKPEMPESQDGRQIVPLPNLQRGLEDLLKTGDCAAFLQKLIAAANAEKGRGRRPHATSFWDAFSRIQDAGGYQLKDVTNGGTVGGDLFFGELTNPSLPEASTAGPGTVYVTPWGPIGRSARPAEVASAQARYIFTAMHETLHLLTRGGYNDKELARAGHKVDGTTAPDYKEDDYLSWSGNLDEVLKRHCKYQSQ